MFKLVTIEDVLLVPARLFGHPRLNALEHVVNKRLSDKVIPGVGLVIAFWDWIKVGEDALQIHSGECSTKCTFRVVVFAPFEGELLFGRVSGAFNEGMFLEMGFFDAITVPLENLPRPSHFDESERVWIWKPVFDEGGEPQTYFMDVTNESVFRAMEVTFEDTWRVPPSEKKGDARNPMSIVGTLFDAVLQDNQGLGDPLWWYEEEEGDQDEEMVEGENSGENVLKQEKVEPIEIGHEAIGENNYKEDHVDSEWHQELEEGY
ncbi:unnamed protein product [Agarophyton chilense]|eukprot:gb/GEZJ01000280.1/.p2 GENE.gb/GEZJ01000280.1/~~gb/GEZJ01000280.1/.p2  ORF type:complete len:262 (-),score=45.13 gb/GEZJ01000280.1/:1332-2117(-)